MTHPRNVQSMGRRFVYILEESFYERNPHTCMNYMPYDKAICFCHGLNIVLVRSFDPLRKIRGEPTSQCRFNLLMVLSLCNSSCQPEYSMQ